MVSENLERQPQEIFAINAAAADLVAPGSFVAGQPIATDDFNLLQNEAYKIGWKACVYGGNSSSFLQEDNALRYMTSYQLAYLLQKGMPEWFQTETYFENDMCQLNGIIYISRTNNNKGNNPTSDTVNWKKFSLPPATSNELGTVIIGNNLSITQAGILSADVSLNNINELQAQIDTITASSDVTDIVGTYTQLLAYNTSTLQNNDIVKVLQDENRNDETTYYRWVITNNTGSWNLIGEEGPYYTIAAADAKFVSQTTTVNGHALNSNITISAGDITTGTFTTSVFPTSGVVAGSYTLANITVDTYGRITSITDGSVSTNVPISTLAAAGTITLADNSINSITPTGNITFTLPTVTDNTIFHQILVQVNLTSVVSITLGTSYYFNKTAPDMSEAGVYNLIYEYDKANQYWVCGVISKGSAS